MNPKIAVTVLALAAVPLGAADFWQEKKFTDWSEKQVKRMLEDSPWARPVAMRDDGPGRSRGGGARDLTDASSNERPSRGGRSSAPPEAPPAVTAILRWHSALPVKQAVARMKYGDAAAAAPESIKVLSRAEERYVLGFARVPAGALRGAGPGLKENIRIRIKGKPDIVAEHVQVDRQGRSVDLYIFFPKGRGIEASDGEMEVSLDLGSTKVNRKFKLKDMVFDGKLEI